MPLLDQQVRDCLSITGGSDIERLFLTAPVKWTDAGEDDEMTALSVGSIDGKQRGEAVATLHSLAVRVATSSSRHTQSQEIETVGAPASRPPTYQNQTTLPTRPISIGPATPSSRPASIQPAPPANTNTTSLPDQLVPAGGVSQATPSSRPASIQPAPPANPNTTSLPEQLVPAAGVPQTLHNGGPPDKINLPPPPPPAEMERTKTDFFTPPSDPSDIKTLE